MKDWRLEKNEIEETFEFTERKNSVSNYLA